MGFGSQNSKEKANDALIQQNTKQLGNIASDASARGDKTFKFFKQSTKPAMDFWNTILNGDRTAISQLFGKEIGQIGSNTQNAMRQLWEGPRGGGKVSSGADILNKESEQIGNLFTSAKPMAAQNLQSLGGMFGNMSLGETQAGTGALSSSSNNLFGLNKEQQAVRDQQAAAWTGLGQGIGGLAGAAFGAPMASGGSAGGNLMSKCCFIFLEALNGVLPEHVRELRDYYYYMEPSIADGYKSMAGWLVPLMRRSVTIKSIVNNIMVKPIIQYGRFIKTAEGYDKTNHIIKDIWFMVWKGIGTWIQLKAKLKKQLRMRRRKVLAHS
jgi:hypothetical protein